MRYSRTERKTGTDTETWPRAADLIKLIQLAWHQSKECVRHNDQHPAAFHATNNNTGCLVTIIITSNKKLDYIQSCFVKSGK